MSPRPPYRWKSFWLGLFVLVFLSWAWRDALEMETRVTFSEPNTAWQAGRLDGSTFFVTGRPTLITGVTGGSSIPAWSFHREKKRRSLVNWINYWNASSPADVRYTTIPDPIIVAPCFAAWISWIAWRMWRSQHLETKGFLRR